MTEYDDELKDLFRRKNLENGFSHDEENWKKMSSVLKNEKEDRRRLLVYFSLLLLLLGLGGTWLFVEQRENSMHTLALKPQQSGKKNRAPVANRQQPGPARATPTPVQQEGEALKRDQVKREMQPAETAGASIVTTQQPEPALAKLKQAQQEQATLEHDRVKMEMQPEKKGSVPPNKEASETKDKEGNAGEEMPVATVQLKAEVSDSDQDHHDLTPQQSLSQRDTVFAGHGLATTHLPDTIMPAALAVETNTLPSEKRDSAVAAVIPARDGVPFKTMPSHRIFLEAGLNYLLGWKTNNKTEASGFNPLIGLQYYHDVSRRIGLSIGLQYSTINHLNNTSHTSITTRLKFGEENNVTVISALNMHYLLMPLKLSYGLSRNDFVCVGYTMAYLLDVESRVEKYSTRLDYSSTPVVSRSMSYTSGFNPYDGQITVCYRRRLYKEWYVSGELFYGLSDIKNNAVYTSGGFERTSGFRLSLGINLWKK